VSEINWNAELRKIVREFDGLPPERTRTQVRLEKIREIAKREAFNERLSIMGLWTQLALVGALATSLFWWPYGRDCGYPLVAFLVSHLMVLIGGSAILLRGWRDRMAFPFTGAAVFIMISWTVIALHALPRMGYSGVRGGTAYWTCVAER
jgi:hypothetical protein